MVVAVVGGGGGVGSDREGGEACSGTGGIGATRSNDGDDVVTSVGAGSN